MSGARASQAPLPEEDRRRLLIGVLALQGDVAEHVALLRSMEVEVREVRLPSDLAGLDGLVIPGGESTTFQLLIDAAGLRDPMGRMIESGLPVLGTCAGMILLSREVLDGRPDQWSYGAIDLAVRRNAFGRQRESFEADLELQGIAGGPMHAVFIRAPFVERHGPGVEVLARIGGNGEGRVVACRQGRVIVTAFHPELVGDRRIHDLLLESARRPIGAHRER